MGWFLALFQQDESGKAAPARLPYAKKDYFFSQTERSFYGVLAKAVAGEFVVFSKVRLADLIYVEKGSGAKQAHFNRIQSKHVDFVLCTPDKIQPVLVIELDDSSHERQDRRDRDAFVDDAFAAAKLPILHVPAKQKYSPLELKAAIEQQLR
jgi:hypothetical protein